MHASPRHSHANQLFHDMLSYSFGHKWSYKGLGELVTQTACQWKIWWSDISPVLPVQREFQTFFLTWFCESFQSRKTVNLKYSKLSVVMFVNIYQALIKCVTSHICIFCICIATLLQLKRRINFLPWRIICIVHFRCIPVLCILLVLWDRLMKPRLLSSWQLYPGTHSATSSGLPSAVHLLLL